VPHTCPTGKFLYRKFEPLPIGNHARILIFGTPFRAAVKDGREAGEANP
jgi:hypothetical protein